MYGENQTTVQQTQLNLQNHRNQPNSHKQSTIAETIICTSRLVGYQSTSRRQYYEVG